jgi:hypothetical protein
VKTERLPSAAGLSVTTVRIGGAVAVLRPRYFELYLSQERPIAQPVTKSLNKGIEKTATAASQCNAPSGFGYG